GGIGPGRLVGGDRLDAAPAQQAAGGVDLLGGEGVAAQRGRAKDRAWSRQDRDVAELDRSLGHAPPGRLLGGGRRRHHRFGGRHPGGGRPQRAPESREELAAIHRLIHLVPPWGGGLAPSDGGRRPGRAAQRTVTVIV